MRISQFPVRRKGASGRVRDSFDGLADNKAAKAVSGSQLRDQAATKAHRNSLCPVPSTQLAEEPTSVGFDGVLGQEQFLADLAVRLTLAHAAQNLEFPFG